MGALVEPTATMNNLSFGEHLRARLNIMYPLINQNPLGAIRTKTDGSFLLFIMRVGLGAVKYHLSL
jgi:hypothetical protein